MKPTKEQIKIALKKVLFWKREQKNKEENTVSTKDEIENEETLNDIPVLDNVQGENENKKLSTIHKEVLKSKIIETANKNSKFKVITDEVISKNQERRKQNETLALANEQVANENMKLNQLQRAVIKAKIIREAEKNPKFRESILKSQEGKKHNETPKFNNEQMLLHFLDKREEVELKFWKELISTEEDLNIIFQNQVIAIEPSLVVSAFAYEELNNTYRLEAKTLIDEIMLRVGYCHVSEALIIDFLKEIIREKKLQIKKEAFKRKVVWLKK